MKMNSRDIEFKKQVLKIDAEKLVDLPTVLRIVEQAKRQGKRVVWANGCFDILHVGHILYLERAKSLGDILIVGLNSDDSVKAFKGPHRPIAEEMHRAKILTSLRCVDYVIIFSEKSPINLLKTLKPHIYVKGGDYSIDTIDQNERRAIENYGGKIVLLPKQEGISTSSIIQKILAMYKK